MRILHIIERYWPAYGGAEAHFRELSVRLAADGHQVTVATSDALDFELLFTPNRRRVTQLQEEHEGVQILRFPVRHLPGCPLTYAAWRRLLWVLSVVRPVPVQIISLMARFTPWVPGLWHWLATTHAAFDLVAGMNIAFEAPLLAGLRYAQSHGLPFILYPITHLGAGASPGSDRVGRFYTMRHQLHLVKSSALVIAQTATERAFYESQGIPTHRVVAVGPGVNPAEVLKGDGTGFRTRHNLQGPLVGYLGALTYDKGTVHVVEAVRQLWRAGRQVDLVLGGAMLSSFQGYLDRLPAEERRRVHLLGPISEQQKRDLLAAVDIVAMPSRTESVGILYLEAWLYRKPVIGARAWGMGDVIDDGIDGILVPFGDVAALAGATAFLLDHAPTREAMGLAGEQKVRSRHTWDLKYGAVRDLYVRLTRSV